MELSVVIPVYNAEKTITRCLESIYSQTFKEFELILVDNNSTDNSARLIEDFISKNKGLNIHLFHEPKQGSCAARNRGARNARGKIIVNTDPDCIADKNWLKDIASAFDATPTASPLYKGGDGGVGAVAGNIYGFNPQGIIEKFLSLFTLRGLGEQKIFDRYDLLTGGFATANLSVKKNVFEKIGGFDEDINIYGEDHDICARIYKAGYKIITVRDALIYHIHRNDLQGFVRQNINFGIAHSALLRKHFPRGLFLELPRFTYMKEEGFTLPTTSFGIPVWLNLNSIDKKIFFICFIGYLFPSAMILLPLYLTYEVYDIKKRGERLDMRISIFEGLEMAGLLFVKSLFITFGSIYGSFKNRVLCI
jgi:glycosyltransferase involved in cell wall biosynthesis